MEKARIRGPVVADTGFLYALADGSDSWHERAVQFTESFQGHLIVPSSVLPETCYLLNSFLGAESERTFLASVVRREIVVEQLREADLQRCMELLEKYQDLNPGFIDASVVVIAERLGVHHIATTDRRHFTVFKRRDGKNFTLLP